MKDKITLPREESITDFAPPIQKQCVSNLSRRLEVRETDDALKQNTEDVRVTGLFCPLLGGTSFIRRRRRMVYI